MALLGFTLPPDSGEKLTLGKSVSPALVYVMLIHALCKTVKLIQCQLDSPISTALLSFAHNFTNHDAVSPLLIYLPTSRIFVLSVWRALHRFPFDRAYRVRHLLANQGRVQAAKRYSENIWIARKETTTLFTNFDWNLAILLCWLSVNYFALRLADERNVNKDERMWLCAYWMLPTSFRVSIWGLVGLTPPSCPPVLPLPPVSYQPRQN